LRPADFANQIELKTDNMWGITKAVMKRLLSLPSDANLPKFLLLKDPNQPVVNIYKVPADSFDYEEEEETVAVQDDEYDSDVE
jgi:translation initiation factor 3 subunit D